MLPFLLLNHNPLAAVTQPNIFYLLYINLNVIKTHIHTRLGQINSLKVLPKKAQKRCPAVSGLAKKKETGTSLWNNIFIFQKY